MKYRLGRREFIALLAGTLVGCAKAAAQPRERARRLGVLMGYTADDREAKVRLEAFKHALAQLGWAGLCLRVRYLPVLCNGEGHPHGATDARVKQDRRILRSDARDKPW